MRLVSLAASNTEILHALGMAPHLVGVDTHSDYPSEALKGLPRLGPELEIDTGAVAALRPDLVLASLSVPGQEHVVRALREKKLPLLVLDPVCLAEVLRDIQTIADRLEVSERGRRVVGDIREALQSIVAQRQRGGGDEGARAMGQDSSPAILIQWWPKPVISPGRLSWVQDLLGIAGATNPLGKEEIRSRPISDEEVAEMEPEAIVISWCGVSPSKYRPDVVRRNPLWRGIPAVRDAQIHCIPEAFLGRPGPRLVEGARALSRIVGKLRGG